MTVPRIPLLTLSQTKADPYCAGLAEAPVLMDRALGVSAALSMACLVSADYQRVRAQS